MTDIVVDDLVVPRAPAGSIDIDLVMPEKLQFLFRPRRYKIPYGGRGSGKSWGCADALLLYGAFDRPERVLCAREVQKSIKESVHHLLAEQIQVLGLGHKYEVLDQVIRGINGNKSEFVFAGLSNQTAESIKSFEGVTKVWVEEAANVTKRSWQTLIPTIRRPGSEIWVSFNPMLDTDETYKRFVLTPPPSSHVEFINYYDNPFFPEVLEQERQHSKATDDEEDYNNIWEGLCRSAVQGAIYAKEMAFLAANKRVGNLPYDPRLRVHRIWDLGWNDQTAVILVQRGLREIRIIGYLEDSHKTLEWYVTELNQNRFSWGYDWIPHDGFKGSLQKGTQTVAKDLKKLGCKVREIPNIGVENGIKLGRALFARAYFDRAKTERLRECLKRYRRHINREGTAENPVHDEYSNGADAWRYTGVVAESLTNDIDPEPTTVIQDEEVYDTGAGY